MNKTVIIPEELRPTKKYLDEILKKMDKLGCVRFGNYGINELYCKLHGKNNYVYVTENPCSSKPRTLVMTYENWADLYLMGYDTEYLTPKEAEEIDKVHNKEGFSSAPYDDLGTAVKIEPMIPVSEIIKLKNEIKKIHDDMDAKAKAQEPYRGFNEKADLACFLYRNDFIKPLNDLIKQYGGEEEEELER